MTGTRAEDGSLEVSGTVRPLVHGAVVTHALVPVAVGGATTWVLLEHGDAAAVGELPTFDPTRPCAAWNLDRARVVPDRVLDEATTGMVRDLALVVASAEAVGGARWCLDTAAEHAADP